MAQIEEDPRTDLRQSPAYTKYMASIGWQVDSIGDTAVFSKKLPLVGTLVKIQRPSLPLPLEEIDDLAQKKRAFLVKIEPNLLVDGFNPRVMGGFRKDSSPILPTKTIWIDLRLNIETLFGNLDKDSRNLVRKAEKEGVVVVESKDLKNFYQLWADNAKKKGFFLPFEKEMSSLWKAFPEKHLLIAKYHGRVAAAALLFGYEKVIYYSFAASSDQGRDVHAPYLLLWEVIKRGKSWDYERLDLEGVSDKKVGRTKSWAGFSHFKKGFGGKEVEFVGSFSKAYKWWGELLGKFV